MIRRAEDLYDVGTLGQIVQMLKLPDGTVKVLVEGKIRGRIEALVQQEECLFVDIEELPDEPVHLARSGGPDP